MSLSTEYFNLASMFSKYIPVGSEECTAQVKNVIKDN